MRRKYKDEINLWVDIAGHNADDATHNLKQFLLMRTEREKWRQIATALHNHLDMLCRQNYEHRYERNMPCSGCFDAVDAYNKMFEKGNKK